jgi:hypothetical protein
MSLYAANETVQEETFPTHTRWNVYVDKNQIQIEKQKKSIFIKTLDLEVFALLQEALKNYQTKNKYITEVKILNSDSSGISTIEVKLASDKVDLFTFYRDTDKKYILDFWTNEEPEKLTKNIPDQKAAEKEVAPINVVKTEKVTAPVVKPVAKNKDELKEVTKMREEEKRLAQLEVVNPHLKDGHRDFRYGAAMMWDYAAILPPPPRLVNLEVKTPEFFYPVQDIESMKTEKEAHAQLAINLFRGKKWGLMYKTMKLYEEKFHDKTYNNLFEYLKVNAIIKNNIENKDTAAIKMAVNMMKNLELKADVYDMKVGLQKFIIQYFVERSDYIRTLQYAKKYYVTTRENFDYEETKKAVELMLYSMAKVNLDDQIREMMQDKTIAKIVKTQLFIAYDIYSNLQRNNIDEVIRIFEKNRLGLIKPIDHTILYNVAEAYFRKAKFTEAIALYDEFLASSSHVTESGAIRLRKALCSEILDYDIKEVTALYENAVNLTQDKMISMEAKLRYVALRNIRKINPTDDDKELRALLNFEEPKNSLETNGMLKLLWLVRLRLYIVDQEYDKALAYISAIPMSALKPSERRVLDADGAEVVYGLLLKNYKDSQYSKVVKIWSAFKKDYVEKVALDPFMNYLVGHSYIKLKTYDLYDKLYVDFQKLKGNPERTYPIWVDRGIQKDGQEAMAELNIARDISLKNYDVALKNLGDLKSKNPESIQYHGYMAEISFEQKDFKKAIGFYEEYLSRVEVKDSLDYSEMAQIFKNYLDSVYESGESEKFVKVSKAILKDTKSVSAKNKFMENVRERAAYLLIEHYYGKNNKESFTILEKEVKDFQNEFKKSQYKGRTSYLLGMAYLENKKESEGKSILEKLLDDKEIPGHIKELVKTELSLLKIKERTL